MYLNVVKVGFALTCTQGSRELALKVFYVPFVLDSKIQSDRFHGLGSIEFVRHQAVCHLARDAPQSQSWYFQ